MSSFNEESRGRRPSGDALLSPVALEARRQLALDRLTEAFASDIVTMDDYEARVARVQDAKLPREIDDVVYDLPAAGSAAGKAGRQAPRRAAQDRGTTAVSCPNAIDPRLSGSESVACVMGDRHLQGDWLQGDKVDSFTMMGSTKFDFRDTTLPPGRVKIDAFCLMGDVKIIVPHGLPVKMKAFPFMGDARIGRDVERRVSPGEPYIEISGFVMMGDLQVQAAD